MLTRRRALASAAILPAATLAPTFAAADGHASAARTTPTHQTFGVGDLQVTVLLAGAGPREGDMQDIFGMNVDAETFAEVSRQAFLPTDEAAFLFQPVVVRNGDDVVLFDTGTNAPGLLDAMAGAGLSPADVTTLVITHMHGDHVGGLVTDGAPTFANARHITGEVEMAAWREQGLPENVATLEDQFELIAEGAEIAPGMVAEAMFGHTPGHMGYRLSSATRRRCCART